MSEHVMLHEAGSLSARVRELLAPYEADAQHCGLRKVLKLTLDEAMQLVTGACEVRDAQWWGRGRCLRYIAFVLAGTEDEEAQLAADRAKEELTRLRAQVLEQANEIARLRTR